MGENDVLTMLDADKKNQQKTEGVAAPEQDTQQDGGQNEQQEAGTFLFDALSDDEVNGVLKDMRHSLVVLIGLPGSGKSTFVGSMYHLLMTKASVGNYYMIDSDTYVGLERRVYLRYAHGPNLKHTKRTGDLEGHVLTLELAEKGGKNTLQLIVSDRTGERYREYAKGTKDMSGDLTLLSTEHLYIFVAADILTGSEYLSVMDYYEKIANQLKAAGVIERTKTITLVFNKIDLVKDAMERFNKKKTAFIAAMNKAMGLEGTDNCNVQSNNIDSAELKTLIEQLISYSFADYDETDEPELDWVKEKIDKYTKL